MTKPGESVVLKDEWKLGEVPAWPLLGPMRAVMIPEGTKAVIVAPPGMDGYVVVFIGSEAYNVWHGNVRNESLN